MAISDAARFLNRQTAKPVSPPAETKPLLSPNAVGMNRNTLAIHPEAKVGPTSLQAAGYPILIGDGFQAPVPQSVTRSSSYKAPSYSNYSPSAPSYTPVPQEVVPVDNTTSTIETKVREYVGNTPEDLVGVVKDEVSEIAETQPEGRLLEILKGTKIPEWYHKMPKPVKTSLEAAWRSVLDSVPGYVTAETIFKARTGKPQPLSEYLKGMIVAPAGTKKVFTLLTTLKALEENSPEVEKSSLVAGDAAAAIGTFGALASLVATAGPIVAGALPTLISTWTAWRVNKATINTNEDVSAMRKSLEEFLKEKEKEKTGDVDPNGSGKKDDPEGGEIPGPVDDPGVSAAEEKAKADEAQRLTDERLRQEKEMLALKQQMSELNNANASLRTLITQMEIGAARGIGSELAKKLPGDEGSTPISTGGGGSSSRPRAVAKINELRKLTNKSKKKKKVSAKQEGYSPSRGEEIDYPTLI